MNALSAAIEAGFPCEPFAGQEGFYVYFLCDPQTDDVFYVGKGVGTRCLTHERDCRNSQISNGRKHQRIRDILAEGETVRKVCVQSGLTDAGAYKLEREMIRAIGINNLTNVAPGQKSEAERAIAMAEDALSRFIPLGQMTDKQRAMYPVIVAQLHEDIAFARRQIDGAA